MINLPFCETDIYFLHFVNWIKFKNNHYISYSRRRNKLFDVAEGNCCKPFGGWLYIIWNVIFHFCEFKWIKYLFTIGFWYIFYQLTYFHRVANLFSMNKNCSNQEQTAFQSEQGFLMGQGKQSCNILKIVLLINISKNKSLNILTFLIILIRSGIKFLTFWPILTNNLRPNIVNDILSF